MGLRGVQRVGANNALRQRGGRGCGGEGLPKFDISSPQGVRMFSVITLICSQGLLGWGWGWGGGVEVEVEGHFHQA